MNWRGDGGRGRKSLSTRENHMQLTEDDRQGVNSRTTGKVQSHLRIMEIKEAFPSLSQIWGK